MKLQKKNKITDVIDAIIFIVFRYLSLDNKIEGHCQAK